MPTLLDRRNFMHRGAALIGCSAAAHPLMTTVTFASAPWEHRLVVLILRGGMDGLDVIQPVGDPNFAGLRPQIDQARGQPLPLDGFWALHPALAPLMPLWQAGDLGFVQAVSTPYRNKRSHFDGQDLLEAGTGMDVAKARDGWLNRMLQTVPDLSGQTAFAIGRDQLKLLSGRADVSNWSPDTSLSLSPQAKLLLEHVYHEDPIFRDTAAEAIELAELGAPDANTARGAELAQLMRKGGGGAAEALAAFAAERLYGDSRIAAFSVPGWDTHRNQGRTLTRTLAQLGGVIQTLQLGLGPVWDKTAIVAMTEFGRTARANGSAGTDHGTGGAMVLAGGAVRGGKVYGHWPGLAESDLFDRRDLMPTGDVRAYAAWAMRGLFGIDRSALEGTVFPGLDMGADPGLLI